jgi:tagatose-6-phosphate ketose/aldose isomerase
MPVKHHHAALSIPALSAATPAEQRRLGYADTLREILQQPETWRGTAAHLAVADIATVLHDALAFAPQHIVLTGSGSSIYVGECLAPLLQSALGIPCQAIPAGTLLTHRSSVLPAGRGLLISIARSGDSPESTGVVDQLLAAESGYEHLVITCNARGGLATRYGDESRLRVVTLDERTNDRSLVMTSSFTNMLLAGSGLLHGSHHGHGSASGANAAAGLLESLFARYGDALAQMASGDLSTAVYLGSGPAIGAAKESALKMLEMSGGAVSALAETFLGLRHGPMSWLNQPGWVVAFLSPEPGVRAYETDLLGELSRKRLGASRVVVGEQIPAELIGEAGLAIELPGLYRLPQAQQLMIHVAVGQLLAFFRCLYLGQQPDAPSQGVLTRVVEDFAIHHKDAAA